MNDKDLQEIKNDIKHLDKKIDKLEEGSIKSEENTNKRLEKIEDNMMKFTETISGAICKLTDSMNDMKLVLVKDYVEKEDLEKVEIELTEKINENNSNRKKDIKELDDKVNNIEKDGSITFNEVLRYVFFILVSSGVTYIVLK